MLDLLQNFDAQTLVAIRSIAIPHPELAKWFVKIFADLEVLVFALLLVVFWLRGSFTKKESYKIETFRIFLVVGGAFCVYLVMNFAFPLRPRPETVTAIAPMIAHLPDNSFPSGHAIFAAASAYALFVFFSRKWVAWSFLVLGIIMCFARVLAGVHYPGDILVGYVIGWIIACGAGYFVKQIPEKHAIFQLPIKAASWIRL